MTVHFPTVGKINRTESFALCLTNIAWNDARIKKSSLASGATDDGADEKKKQVLSKIKE